MLRMSLQAKLVLGSACVFSLSIIAYVHIKQYIDREKLHEGVLKDIERRQRRKAENLYVLQQQIDLAKEIKKKQDQNDTSVS